MGYQECFNVTSRIGLHFRTEALMNTIPMRDIVAGEALSTLSGSKTNLLFGIMIIRSPLASVKVWLSSKTEFKFSIQTASTGPSRTIQRLSVFFVCVDLLHIVENMPSVQSFVATSSLPNICDAVIACKATLVASSLVNHSLIRLGKAVDLWVHPDLLVRHAHLR